MIDRFRQQIRHAVRVLVRAPLFTLTAITSLAIGLGANTTIFTIANALLLAPTRGVEAMDRLVDVGRSTHHAGFDTVGFPTYADLRDHNTVFSGMYAVKFEPRAVSLGGLDGADRAYSQQVSASYFDVLGVQPAAGRFFHTADEHAAGPLRQVVASYAFWQKRFSADPAAIGQTLVLNADAFTLVGVAPQNHTGATILAPDLWVPLNAFARAMATEDLVRSRDSSWLIMGARLKPGVTVTQAQADMDRLMTGLTREYPVAYADKGLVVVHASRLPGLGADVIVPFLGVLAVVVGLVLLVACTNLAGLMLARAASRSREVAVRLALGASRGQIVSQFLTESLLVFVGGCLAAIALSRVMTAVVISFLPSLPVPVAVDFAQDGRVWLFSGALALVTGLLTGLVPALQSTRASMVADLKNDSAAGGRPRLRHSFIAAQMGLCLVLLVAAGLFLRAFEAALDVQPGFDVDAIDVASINLSTRGYADAQLGEVTRDIQTRLAALPGVTGAGAAAVVPLGGDGLGLGALRRPGGAPAGEGDTDWNVVTPEFFETINLPLIRGRNFSAEDRANAPDVAIVNETMTRRWWPGEEALGQRLEVGDFRPGREHVDRVLTVVGVARDAKYRWLGDGPRNFLYVPIAQQAWGSPHFFLRHDGRLASGGGLTGAIRAALKDVDPNLPLVRVAPLRDSADFGLLPQRLAASIAGSLGGVALLLAGIGLYGITAFTVARRTREIGLRMALGASPNRLQALVVLQSLKLTAIGAGVGLLFAAGLARLVSEMLFGVSPLDPVAFGGTVAVLALVAAVASYVPARRAARVNPVVALRTD